MVNDLGTYALAIIVMLLLALDCWKTYKNNKLIKELTAMVAAKDVFEYKQMVEPTTAPPPKRVRDLNVEPKDPVLGANY